MFSFSLSLLTLYLLIRILVTLDWESTQFFKVYVCVCGIYVWVHVYTCVWRPEVNIGCQSLTSLFIEAESLAEPGAYRFCYSSLPAYSRHLLSVPVLGL